MKSLEKNWRYLLIEPFIWIVYCFFQPARFQREIEIPGYFKLKRIVPLLRASIPLFLCSFLFFCCALSIAIIFHSFVINTPKFLSIIGWLMLGLIILTILGGLILSIARGIVLASIWSITYTIIYLFFISNPNNSDTPLSVLLGFGISGGILFGTAFGNSSDLSGDLIGNIVWTAGIFSIEMITVHTWATIDFFFVAVSLGSITGGIIWFMMRRTKNPEREKVLKKSLLWGNIWGMSLAIQLGIMASTDPTSPIIALSTLAYGIFCFFGVIIYIAGYYRLLLYPFCLFSTLNTYLLGKLYPSNVFRYLHHCSLYWDECVFLPLFGLKQTLLIAAQQDEGGRRTMEEINFIIDERPQQINIARAVSQELAMRDLEKRRDFPTIAQAHKQLAVFLPQKAALIDPHWTASLSPLDDASHDVDGYSNLANRQARQRILHRMIANLERARAKTPFGDARLNKRLGEVINTWLAVTQQEYTRLGEAPASIGQIDNPFCPGEPLKLHDSLFVGRLDLAQQLEDALSRKKHRPTFLLNGERRMGKTSILLQLPALLGPHYLPIFYDLQEPGMSSSAAAFLTNVARAIGEFMQSKGMRVEKLEFARLQEASQKNEAAAYRLFEVWLRDVEHDLEQEDKILLLTFDEFEILAEADQTVYLNLNLLLDWFHSIIQHHPRLALLFSGERAFSEMGPHWISHFVTVQPLRVSFLRSAEVRKLITQLDDPDFSAEQLFNEDIVEEIIRVTACHPFLVQAICSVLIDALNLDERTRADLSDVEAAINQVLENWNQYFLDLWMRADDNQKSCLRTIASLGICDSLYIEQQTALDTRIIQRTLQYLLKHDLIHVEDSNYHIAVPIFRAWIEQNNGLPEPDWLDFSSNHPHNLPANDDFEPSELERENQVSSLQSATQPPLIPSAIARPARLLLISFALLSIIVGSILMAPTILNNFANISRVTPTIGAATATASTIAANPDPYLPGSGRLILYDPLKKANSTWSVVKGTCTFKKDGYHVTQYPVWFTVCVTHSASFNNFVFEAGMKIIAGDGGGISFRTTYNHYSGYTLFVLKNGHYQLGLYLNQHYTKTLAQGTSAAFKQGLNQTNVLAVIAQGSTFKLYMNHQLIAHFNDNAYSQGQIGFIADAISSSADIAYTDAKIWAL